MKIGTFKGDFNRFRLGERFFKIVFDNALRQNIYEIYVTIFDKRDEQRRLIICLKIGVLCNGKTKNQKMRL